MRKKIGRAPKIPRWLYWTPRILSIAFILFLTLFSFDVIGEGYGFWGTIFAFLMHSIPSVVLTVLLIISWRKPFVGVMTFLGAGLLYIVFVVVKLAKSIAAMEPSWYMLSWPIIISGPAFLIGYFWYLNWQNNKKQRH